MNMKNRFEIKGAENDVSTDLRVLEEARYTLLIPWHYGNFHFCFD
jgi:hypothetical protein